MRFYTHHQMNSRGPDSPLALRVKPLPSKLRSIVNAKLEIQQSILPGQTAGSILTPTEPSAAPLRERPIPSAAATVVQRDASSNSPQSSLNSDLPFFYCKISAKNLPQFDVFSSSDPVCFVTEARSRRIIRERTLSS